jgi:hypothetical protein
LGNEKPAVSCASMEKSPSSETSGFSASKEIPLILWYVMFHYHVFKSQPLDHIQN